MSRGSSRIATDPSIDMLARLGVIVLLFEVGLESTVAQMMQVGVSSLLVAMLGCDRPFVLGWGVGAVLLPEPAPTCTPSSAPRSRPPASASPRACSRTSGSAQTNEARIILGAAVIDDVLGLVILAVMSGIIAAANEGRRALLWRRRLDTCSRRSLFLVGSLVSACGSRRVLFRFASKLQTQGVLLATGLVVLLPAGVARQRDRPRADRRRVRRRPDSRGRALHATSSTAASTALEELVAADHLVPGAGLLRDHGHAHRPARRLRHPGVLGLAAALTVAAIVGKQVCSLGVIGKGLDSALGRHRHDPARRGRPDLRQHRPDAARSAASASWIRTFSRRSW